jgi:hypothetical protein
MKMSLPLHIILQKPPINIHFGLKKGSGSKYETIQIQKSGLNDLHFYSTIEIKDDRQKDNLPGFIGPFVQCTPPNKFIYIDIGAFAGQTTSWNRRLKIPLTGIKWETIDHVKTDSKLVLETCVPGTGKDGGPNCATVKPFDGWKIKMLSN